MTWPLKVSLASVGSSCLQALLTEAGLATKGCSQLAGFGADLALTAGEWYFPGEFQVSSDQAQT